MQRLPGAPPLPPTSPVGATRFAAIDIGTNSVLLTIAEKANGPLQPVLERAEITRLGKDTAATGQLSREGIERTLAVLAEYATAARDLGAERIAAVATSAARDAANGEQFLEQARRATGLEIEIISGGREAELSFQAAAADFGGPAQSLVVVDVGGGSTEFAFGVAGTPSFHASLDIGSVRLTERYVKDDPPSTWEREAVRAAADWALELLPVPPIGSNLIALAGTATTLASLALGLERFDATRVHGAKLSGDQVRSLCERLWRMPLSQRLILPGLQPARADVIPAGAEILMRAMERLAFQEVTVSDRGVRWGLLHELGGRQSVPNH
jgi:exopolyphosphatase/guanosine-5'-triphosphate,3'-diphosphate pyrophosphatase